MKVNENVRKEREAILKARREDIRRRKAERERNESAEAIKVEHKRNERVETIKAEKERIRREREELERTIEEMRKRERIRKQQAELRKIERKERIKSIKIIIAVICALGSITFISYVLDPVGFVEFFKTVGSIIVLIITGVVVKFVSSMPHYTTPHRYIVQDEINKNYKVEKGWHTTTFVTKDRR